MLLQAEEIVQGHPDVESYMLRYNNDSGTITAYLRDNRDMSTDEVVEQWETEMADLDNCTVTVEASSFHLPVPVPVPGPGRGEHGF